MGVTITATKSSYSFDMGCGGFFDLRQNIAHILNEELGEVYETLIHCHSREAFEEHDRRAGRVITKYDLDRYSGVLDFLYSSDCGGSANYKVCKQIYDLIKDVDFGDKCFRYAMRAHNDYEEFKAFLMECYSHRRSMRWY
jgi:hypothetical protein